MRKILRGIVCMSVCAGMLDSAAGVAAAATDEDLTSLITTLPEAAPCGVSSHRR